MRGGMALLLWLLALTSCGKKELVSLESVSPNGRFKVQMVELPVFDRNFQLKLISDGKMPELIYSSPDEGRPIGTERIIWSKDSDYLLLIGKEFNAGKEARLSSGEYLYLLYQVSTKKLRGNATQANHQKFTVSDVNGIEFVGKVPDFGQP